MKSPRPICPAWLRACYRISLRTYPAQFRAEYGALMEQAFADRYARFTASGNMSEKIRFALDTLRDSSQSLCSQHWLATEAAGFVRQRFLLLLVLFVPVVFFHQNLIMKASESMTALEATMDALDTAMDNAMDNEYDTYRSKLESRLRQYGDTDSVKAARFVSNRWTTIDDIPEGEALNRMNLRIAREVMAYPFRLSLIARVVDERERYWSDANTVYSIMWPIDNVKQLRACLDHKDFAGKDPACLQAWKDRRRYLQFSKLMYGSGYRRPEVEEFVTALEQNRMEELELNYIALNNLQHCRFIPAQNNVECDKPGAR